MDFGAFWRAVFYAEQDRDEGNSGANGLEEFYQLNETPEC